jgi:hypothetical protein
MSIYSVLRHQARVSRSVRTFDDGQAAYSWTTVGENVAVLLDASKREDGEEFEFEKADRVGLLMSAPDADLRPGDRLTMTRGPVGTFVLKGDPADIPTLHGFSHREFRVTEG